jgi:hypothetical protein
VILLLCSACATTPAPDPALAGIYDRRQGLDLHQLWLRPDGSCAERVWLHDDGGDGTWSEAPARWSRDAKWITIERGNGEVERLLIAQQQGHVELVPPGILHDQGNRLHRNLWVRTAPR